MSERNERKAAVERKTRETEVRVAIDLDGSGQYEVATGPAVLRSHARVVRQARPVRSAARAPRAISRSMRTTRSRTSASRSVRPLREALGSAEGIRRYGTAVLPMAEAKVEVALDVSNRPYFVYQVALANTRIGDFDASLVEDFLYAFSQNAGLDLHVELRYGRNPHHVVEAVFKGVARALRVGVERDARVRGLPTVKGAL